MKKEDAIKHLKDLGIHDFERDLTDKDIDTIFNTKANELVKKKKKLDEKGKELEEELKKEYSKEEDDVEEDDVEEDDVEEYDVENFMNYEDDTIYLIFILLIIIYFYYDDIKKFLKNNFKI